MLPVLCEPVIEDDSLLALSRTHGCTQLYPGMRCAAASSADTPFAVQIARAVLGMLEVVPGVTVAAVLDAGHGDVSQVG